MTIKQTGGIFGRNPSFNDLNVDNDLDIGSTEGKSHWTSGGKMNLSISEAQNYPGISSMSYSTSASAGGMVILGHSDNSTSGSLSETGDGDALGYLVFEGVNSSSSLVSGAYIKGAQDGAAGASYVGGKIEFYTSTGSAAPRQAIRIDKDAHIQMAGGGNVVFTSGAGIDFSATSGTGTSELFDDYEEGTWTPTYSPASGSFTTVPYDGATSGVYTKIGDTVHIVARVRTDATIVLGTASGALRIGGLPYTGTGNASFSVWSRDFNGENPSEALLGSDVITLYYRTAADGTADNPLDVSDLALGNNNKNDVIVSGWYKVA